MLKLDEVPTIMLEGLTDAQKKAYVIADNQLALNAGWDLDSLKLEIEGLGELEFDIDLLGFDDDFLAGLMDSATPNFDPATEDEQGQLDELDPKYIDCPKCGHEFDMRGLK
jgi:ParB family transcriptional regulator, chromosome partitioning protein